MAMLHVASILQTWGSAPHKAWLCSAKPRRQHRRPEIPAMRAAMRGIRAVIFRWAKGEKEEQVCNVPNTAQHDFSKCIERP